MNTTIQCIILLTCAFMCTSQAKPVDSSGGVVMKRCRCVQKSMAVTLSRIADLQIYEPSPHCNEKQIIAVLRGDEGLTETCLNPKSKFVQALERTYLIQKKKLAQVKSGSKQKGATM